MSYPAAPPASRMGAPIAMILGSCVSLQFGAAFAKMLFPELGSWGVTTLRLGLAALLLCAVVRPAVHRWTGRQWRAVLLFGLALGCMNGSFYSSIERIPLGTAVAIEFLGPLVLSAVLSRRPLDLLCVVVALAGVSLFGLESLAGIAVLDPVGVLFALTAGVFWACYVLASAQVGSLVPGHGGLAVAVGIGSLALLPLGVGGVATAIVSPRLLGLALGCSLLASVIPYTLELSALRRLPRHVFGILLSLEPAIAAIAGLALLGERITPLGLIAIVLVVGASIGTTLTARAAQRREARSAASTRDGAAETTGGHDGGSHAIGPDFVPSEVLPTAPSPEEPADPEPAQEGAPPGTRTGSVPSDAETRRP